MALNGDLCHDSYRALFQYNLFIKFIFTIGKVCINSRYIALRLIQISYGEKSESTRYRSIAGLSNPPSPYLNSFGNTNYMDNSTTVCYHVS